MWDKVSVDPEWLAARNLAQPDVPMLRPVSTPTLQVGQNAVISYTGPDGLNLRESPNPQSKVIAYLLNGTQITITNDKLATSEYEWWGAKIPAAYMVEDAATQQLTISIDDERGKGGKAKHRRRKR